MKVAVVYWSQTGNTEAMANKVVEGAKGAGADVDLFTAADFPGVEGYDAVAFGCPAMGSEELESDEFEPMFTAAEPALSGKKVGLFGSYGWGDGEWMRTWQDRTRADGANLVSDGVMANEAPDDAADAACIALGEALTK